jgi:hypothetical protein
MITETQDPLWVFLGLFWELVVEIFFMINGCIGLFFINFWPFGVRQGTMLWEEYWAGILGGLIVLYLVISVASSLQTTEKKDN